MNPNILKVLFLINKTRINSKGEAPIRCRITFNGIRKIFSTGLFINPDNWENTLQIANPPNDPNSYINTQLSLIKQEINQAFLFLKVQKNTFDADDIYLQYKGENIKVEKKLIEVFEMHNDSMKKLIGIEYSKSTHSKFIEAKKHTEDFLKFKYKKKDINLIDLNLKFLHEFEMYLKSERKHKQITINKSIQRLRKIIKLALSEGFIITDPFLLHRPKKVENQVVFLTPKELQELENHKFTQTRLQQVCDMFIFCCYTGLAYNEMSSLTKKNIVKGFDNKLWIDMYRQKTKKQFKIPLLPKAKEILDKYKSNISSQNKLLPIITNQKFNSYLKEIAEILGFEKNLTHHIGRKTFATTILLYNDVPMEIVSELLGHSKMSVTQAHYAKVVQSKISEHISKLNLKLSMK
ncbi:site-specific integrase [Flavobacterium sp.]|uniref:site-specific integrase n=1 Tax=Flavobacterium sp. TaxID=239 RepID=UPI002B9D59D9|nr:site-specific integrase [Flavobacterium sp.]HSD08183.1 site-specific integrase [Flavobacterium sp.]